MNSKPINNALHDDDPDPIPPHRALAIGILPAGLPAHLVPKWGINALDGQDGRGSREPERALAIGPSGPALPPLSKAEIAARAKAVNADPYHDELGRFTTSGGATGLHGPRHDHRERPAQRRESKDAGQEPAMQVTIVSIRDHAYPSNNLQTCVVAAVRSVIATMRASTNDTKQVPSEEEGKKQFQTAAGGGIDWHQGITIPYGNIGEAYGKIVQNVLTQNGIPSTVKSNYPSAKALADDIRAESVPVIANIITDKRGASIVEHAVVIQWDEHDKRFLVNNIDAEGKTTSHPQKEFEYGDLRINADRTGVKVHRYVSIDLHNAVIFARKP